ncbi:MAG: HAMP domain-containing histidine kinase [Novosphingobium sp.]|nr:HAMP domain-containing histidine kinase [Novosphingobium sp.]
MTNDALSQARAQLAEVLEAARKGTIIPVRLPGQLEAIDALLEQVTTGAAAPHKPEPVEAPDLAETMKANAYFVSHAVHELRTPMTSIRGYSDMIVNPAMGTLTDMQKQFMETIRTNARRMDTLLTDVSDMAKLRGGTLRMAEKMDMFKNIAMSVEKAMQPVADEHKRTLTFDLPQGLPLLNTDGDLLAKAVNKLVENALRYNDKPDGKVTVRGRAEGNTLIIEVEDNGIGIAPEDLTHVGEPFYQAHGNYSRRYEGTGLGLSVVRGLVQLHGGRIDIDSTLGQGTTVTVDLPIDGPDDQAMPQVADDIVKPLRPRKASDTDTRATVDSDMAIVAPFVRKAG